MLDYLVIGQGLAGTYFSHELFREGKSFRVISNEISSASSVAAGLCNPVVLKRFRMIWNATEILGVWRPAIDSIEQLIGQNLLLSKGGYRKFSSVEEQNKWIEKSDNPKFEPYLGKVSNHGIGDFKMPFGYGEIENITRLNLPLMLSKWKEKLKQDSSYEMQEFSFSKLKIEDDFVNYDGLKAKNIIFCEGVKVLDNPFFNELPIVPNKGEYIKLQIDKSPDKMIGAGHFILPDSTTQVTVGATYSPNDKSISTTTEKRDELLHFWEKQSNQAYRLVDQVAGLRPTVKDRRPILGRHLSGSNVFILNGFGSRGVLMGPWLSKQLFNYIENGTPIHEECDVKRYYK